MSTPAEQNTAFDLVLIVSGGVVVAICGAIVAWLKWRSPSKPRDSSNGK